MKEGYWLGVDGGGTSCRVRLCDGEGNTLGEGLSGSGNAMLGAEKVFDSINEATQHALKTANLPEDILRYTRAGMGLAGAISEEIRRTILDYPHPFHSITLQTDAHTACLGAHSGNEGAILITGTGSCGLLYKDGRYHNVGGWGFPISDQGSGARLGLKAIQNALQAYDGLAAESDFTLAIMERFDGSPLAIYNWMASATPKDYAAIAPLVIEYNERQDDVASKLLQEAAEDASQIVLRLAELGAEKVCLMGGLAPFLKPKFGNKVMQYLSKPQGDALDGAIYLAQQGGL